MKTRSFRFAVMMAAVALFSAGCGGSMGAHPPLSAQAQLPLARPKSVSPALIKPAPMAKTAILPASAMTALTPSAARRPQMALKGLQWTQMTGAATQVLGSPDGSLWVLSTGPSGPDKYIWHYANGTWTNIAGLASQLAVSNDGQLLYAINSGGGTYQYNVSGNYWTALGGGARWITVANDGSVYVLSNAGGPDYAIWKNQYNTWSQVNGAGVELAGSFDGGTYNATVGTVQPNGVYVLNSAGSIYYLNADGTYAMLNGSASAITPSNTGGLFVLGSPTNVNGNPIYYYDYNAQNPGWNAYGGSGTSLSVNNMHWTSGSNLYVVSGPAGAIWTSPILSTSPSIRAAYQVSPSVNTSNALSAAGSIWWTDGLSIGSISTSFVQGSTYTIPNNNGGSRIQMAFGSDGNLWFTQATPSNSTPDYVVRMLLSGLTGSMNAYQLPVPSGATSGTHAGPVAIALGSDGNLWIAESPSNNVMQIVRMNTSGSITGSFPVVQNPASYTYDHLQSITVGPDGNLWFIIEDTGNGYDEIGKITTSGTITRYHLPNPYSFGSYGQWNSIVAGADGNLWFTEASGNRVAKITTAGVITEYQLPTGTNSEIIAVGPNNTLWLRSEGQPYYLDGIIEVTTAGVVSGPFSTQSVQVSDIFEGPDGNEWINNNNGEFLELSI